MYWVAVITLEYDYSCFEYNKMFYIGEEHFLD